MKPKKLTLLGTLSTVPASLTIFGHVSLILTVGDFAKWLIEKWQVLTRNLWDFALSILNLNLSNEQKDYLTALVFFVPVLIAALRSRKTDVDQSKPKYDVMLAIVIGIVILYLLSAQFFEDLWELLSGTMIQFVLNYMNLLFSLFMLVAWLACIPILVLGTLIIFKKINTLEQVRFPILAAIIFVIVGGAYSALMVLNILSYFELNQWRENLSQVQYFDWLASSVFPGLVLIAGVIALKFIPSDKTKTKKNKQNDETEKEAITKKESNEKGFFMMVTLGIAALVPTIKSVGFFEATVSSLLLVILILTIRFNPGKLVNIGFMVILLVIVGLSIDYIWLAILEVKGFADIEL